MERDGFTSSIWQATTGSYPSRMHFPLETVFDVVVVGGGITGLLTAYELQKTGRICLLIEAHQLGFGTTAGTTAHMNTFLETPYGEVEKNFGEESARKLARAVQEAMNLLRRNVTAHEIDCNFSMLPACLFSGSDEQTEDLNKLVENWRKLGVEVQNAESAYHSVPFLQMVELPGQAQFHPIKYIYAIASLFERSGGHILQFCRLEDLKEQGDIFRIASNLGDILARQVVYATHTPPGVNVLHTLLAPYRSYVVAARLRAGSYPEGLIYDMEDPYHYIRVHEENGNKMLIVGGADHKTGHLPNTRNAYRELEAYVMKHFPVEEFTYRWSSQLYEPADGLAYIGELPGRGNNVYVATGFAGNGMVYSHISAMVIHDLIVKGDSPYKDLFSPKRIKPLASFSSFVSENAGVVKDLLSGILPKEKLEATLELTADEGRVVEYEGQKMGLYKDPLGNIYAVNPVCPHMKCTVEWNNTERSWDCPCHGSRFSFTGELLTGPSRHNLEVYSLQKQSSL